MQQAANGKRSLRSDKDWCGWRKPAPEPIRISISSTPCTDRSLPLLYLSFPVSIVFHSCRQFVFTICLSASLLSGSGTLWATDADEKQQRLDELRREITAIRSELEVIEGERREEVEMLQQAEARIVRLQSELEAHREQQAELASQLQALYGQQSALSDELQRGRDTLAKLVRASYVAGDDRILKVLLNQENPVRVSRMLEYYRYVSQYRAREIESLLRTAADLESVEQDISDTAGETERIIAARQQAQEDLAAQNRERTSLIARLDEEILGGKKRIERLRADEKQLVRLLQELTTLNRQELSAGEDISFARMKGKLTLPVQAPVKAPFGSPRGQGDLVWNGILLATEEGEEIKAIYQGQVIFADFFRGFGLLLIVDHGDGYMSLYSHTQRILKEVGDWITTGEVIAVSGTSGGLKEPGLYFEIRVQGKPDDPLAWCRR